VIDFTFFKDNQHDDDVYIIIIMMMMIIAVENEWAKEKVKQQILLNSSSIYLLLIDQSTNQLISPMLALIFSSILLMKGNLVSISIHLSRKGMSEDAATRHTITSRVDTPILITM
jgi:hypothetical protein